MNIQRIDSYLDSRFPQAVLNQHGAYLVDSDAYWIEITGPQSAVVHGVSPAVYPSLIDEFRFHAPHIVRFYDESSRKIAEYPPPDLLEIPLESIQPSQFFVDEDKLSAARTFIHSAADIIVQVIPYGNRFISLDGHTRLFLAVQNGFCKVKALVSETDDWIWTFVHEAEQRNIFQPGDMILLPHEQYEISWNQYCDSVFAGLEQSGNSGSEQAAKQPPSAGTGNQETP